MHRQFFKYFFLFTLLITVSGCGMTPAIQKGFSIGFKVGEAKAYIKKGQYERAESKFNDALSMCADNVAEQLIRAEILCDLGKMFMEENRYTDAQMKFEASLAIYNNYSGASTRKKLAGHAECLANYAMLLRVLKRDSAASEMETKAKNLRAVL